jgi:hypothetical protein
MPASEQPVEFRTREGLNAEQREVPLLRPLLYHDFP